MEGVKKVLDYIKKEEPKKEEKAYYPPINFWSQQDAGGELYLDRVFKTYQDWRDKREYQATFGEGVSAAFSDNWLIPTIARSITAPTFLTDPDWNLSLPYVEEAWNENNILPQYYDEFVGTVSKEHFDFTMTRVLQAQKNREILDSLGWTGFALEAGAFITDPISWLGY